MSEKKIFSDLKTRYGSNAAAAEAIGVPYRTFMDWRKKGFISATRACTAAAFIQSRTGIVVEPAMLLNSA